MGRVSCPVGVFEIPWIICHIIMGLTDTLYRYTGNLQYSDMVAGSQAYCLEGCQDTRDT